MRYKNILLTGSTGVVGQHILFELLNHYETNRIDGKIHLIVRSTANQNSVERIESLLNHLFRPDYLKNYDTKQLMSHIVTYDTDLTSPNIASLLSCLKKEDDICVVHCAASTNLMSNEDAEKELKTSNYDATLNLLKTCLPFASKFSFISTAFSCGFRKGLIDEDYISYEQSRFRNPYERNKSLAEKEIARICKENQLSFQILRPSIVCGRLYDAPIYYTPKFDVFYGYTKFFYKVMETPYANVPLRIVADPERAVSNVISVDYVAKAIARAIYRDDIVQMNIANSKSVPLHFSLYKMIEFNGFKNYSVVKEIPRDMNELEMAYYSKLGNISTPYLYDDTFEFDTRKVRELMADYAEPNIEEQTDRILQFAKDQKFSH